MIFADALDPDDVATFRAAMHDRGGQAPLVVLCQDVGLPADAVDLAEAALLESVLEGGRLPFATPSTEHDAAGRQLWRVLEQASPDDCALGGALLIARGEEAMRIARRLEAEREARARLDGEELPALEAIE